MKTRILALILAVLVFGIQIPGTHALELSDSSDHEIQMLPSGIASLEARLRMIERARSSIELETFIYTDDFSGRLVAQALAKRAREGVRVRVLIDALPILLGINPHLARELIQSGIELRYFNPGGMVRIGVSKRNHRKHLIIDGEDPARVEVLTGGRNIANEYFDINSDYIFRDLDVWVKGPIGTAIWASFNQVWNSKSSKSPPEPKLPQPPAASPRIMSDSFHKENLKRLHEKAIRRFEDRQDEAKVFLGVELQQKAVAAWRERGALLLDGYRTFRGPVTYWTDLPGSKSNRGQAWRHTREKLLGASFSILGVAPYLILRQDGFEMLRDLKARDVKVELVTNSLFSSDWLLPIYGYRNQAKKIHAHGAEVWSYDGSACNECKNDIPANRAKMGLHGKSFIIDDRDVIIGTLNLDPASFRLNLENMFYFPDQPEMAAELSGQLQHLMEESHLPYQIDPKSGRTVYAPTEADFPDPSMRQPLPIWVQKLVAFLFPSRL